MINEQLEIMYNLAIFMNVTKTHIILNYAYKDLCHYYYSNLSCHIHTCMCIIKQLLTFMEDEAIFGENPRPMKPVPEHQTNSLAHLHSYATYFSTLVIQTMVHTIESTCSLGLDSL